MVRRCVIIKKEFWKQVEKPMKHVLYGDSVAGSCLTGIEIAGELYYETFDGIWNLLISNGFEPILDTTQNKERIFFNDTVNIISANVDGKLETTSPLYVMRHRVNRSLVELSFERYQRRLLVTKNHSMMDWNGSILSKCGVDKLTTVITTSGIRKLVSKKVVKYDGYVYDFEVPETHTFLANGIVVHNTDSLFIDVPIDETKEYTTEDLIEIANKVSDGINERITYATESFILPKLGVDISHNKTFFKTELVADAIMFLDVKKNYAYHELANNGKLTNPDEGGTVEYKGIPVVKSNVAPISKKFIRRLVETIVLDGKVQNIDMSKLMEKTARDIWQDVNGAIKTGDFIQFATPCKWSGGDYAREPAQIVAMRIYNTITNSETFTPLSSGMFFPIDSKSMFIGTLSKMIATQNSQVNIKPEHIQKAINHIAVPYGFNPEETLELFKSYDLSIDPQTIFNLINTKVTERICNVIKLYALK